MIHPYSMIFFNIVAFATAIILYFLITMKYPKINKYSIPFLLLFSLLPILSIARTGTYESGDLSINVYKTIELWRSLQEGNIIPTWAGNLNSMYGYPLFVFTYPLPYFLNAFFHLIGFSFISSVKMTLVISFLLSGVFMYYFLRERFSAHSSYFGSILYLYAPYHLVDMHFRVDIGEMWAIMFIPLIFLSIEKLSLKKLIPIWITIGSTSIALLILSHQAVSLTALPFTVLYVFFINKSDALKKIWWRFIIVYILGLLLSGFYVFPLLYLKQFTVQSLGVSMSFATVKDLLFSPYRYGLLFQGPNGELSFLVGYVQLTLIILGAWIYLKNKLPHTFKKIFLFTFLGIGVLVFCMLKISEPLWNILPLIKNFQFSIRLLSVVIFLFAILGALVAEYTKKTFIVQILIFLTIFTTILNWGNRRVISQIDDTQLIQNVPTSTYYGEGLSPASPKWVDPQHVWMKDVPKNPLEIISGNADITVLERRINKHRYNVLVKETSEFKENTLYFPNWNVQANNKQQPITYQNYKYPGIITFTLPKGNYSVVVRYDNPTITTISQYISLFSFFTLIVLNLFINYKFLLAFFHKKR